MGTMRIHLDDVVQDSEEEMILELKRRLPVLREAQISVLPGTEGRRVLEIRSTKAALDSVKRIIAEHVLYECEEENSMAQQNPQQQAKPQNPQARQQAQAQNPQEQQVYQQSSEEEEIRRMLEMAPRVPGAKQVIEAALETMSAVQEIVQIEAGKILGHVASLETKTASLETKTASLETKTASLETKTASLEDRLSGEISNLKSSLKAVQVEVGMFGAFKELLKEAVTKG